MGIRIIPYSNIYKLYMKQKFNITHRVRDLFKKGGIKLQNHSLPRLLSGLCHKPLNHHSRSIHLVQCGSQCLNQLQKLRLEAFTANQETWGKVRQGGKLTPQVMWGDDTKSGAHLCIIASCRCHTYAFITLISQDNISVTAKAESVSGVGNVTTCQGT